MFLAQTRRRNHGATNRTTRLVFDKNSRMVEVNGTDVALSFPVASDHGALLVAQMDLNTAIRPLLFPPRFADAKRITTICLDPGHGGKDTGNHTFWRSEKTYTLALALELRDQLQKSGFNVILTRIRDTTVELPDRPALANRRGADLFVSLHFNATPTGKNEVEGPQTYCITPVGASSTDAQGEGANFGATTANRVEQKSLLLAYQVQKSLVRNLGAKDRGVRRARYWVLRDATMPAILIEGGYMTHPARKQKDLQRCVSPPDGAVNCDRHSDLSKTDFTAATDVAGHQPSGGEKSDGHGKGREQGFDSKTHAVKMESLISKLWRL